MKISNIVESRQIFEDEDLPDHVGKAFAAIGDQQRGYPEQVMLKIQHLIGGGVLNVVVEHGGDILHRMTHMADRGMFFPDLVYEKTNKCYRFLAREYGFEKEMHENLKVNAEYRDISYEDMVSKLDDLLAEYAKAHSQLPVYNRLQKMARDIAVNIGEKKWNLAAFDCQSLRAYAKNRETFDNLASKYHLDKNGNLRRIG